MVPPAPGTGQEPHDGQFHGQDHGDEAWPATHPNRLLRTNASIFHKDPEHAGSTILMYSSYALFSNVIAEPEKYGFPPGDIKRRGGSIWMDHLHPTSKMHKVLADDIEEFLKTFAAHKADGGVAKAADGADSEAER